MEILKMVKDWLDEKKITKLVGYLSHIFVFFFSENIIKTKIF